MNEQVESTVDRTTNPGANGMKKSYLIDQVLDSPQFRTYLWHKSMTAPYRLWIELTRRCNLACSHCYNSSGKPLDNELTHSELINLINQACEMGVFEIGFTGGEPMLHDHFFKLAQEIKKNKKILTMATNAQLITKDNAQTIANLFDEVMISIDGVDETHDRLRNQRGAFKKAIASIEYLLEAKKKISNNLRIRIMTVINRESVSDIDELLKLSLEYKLWKHSFRFIRFAGRAKNSSDTLSLDPLLKKDTARYLFEKKTSLKDKIHVDTDLCFQFEIDQELIKKGKTDGCGCGKRSIGIASDGVVTPCTFAEIEVGNIRKDSLFDIWFNSPGLTLFRNITKETLEEPCRSCKYFTICQGGCRSAAIDYSNGNFFAADPNCPVVKEYTNGKE